MLNYYQLMGVPNFATFDEVSAAYKKKYNELFSSESVELSSSVSGEL